MWISLKSLSREQQLMSYLQLYDLWLTYRNSCKVVKIEFDFLDRFKTKQKDGLYISYQYHK